MESCGGGRRRRIVPGERVGETADGLIYGVASFLEKPALESARVCLAADWLWNTFVFVTALPTLLPSGAPWCPTSMSGWRASAPSRVPSTRPGPSARPMARSSPGTPSPSILQECPPGLAVSKLAPVERFRLNSLGASALPSLVPVPATSSTVATPGAAPCFNKPRCNMPASLTDNAYDGAYDGTSGIPGKGGPT